MFLDCTKEKRLRGDVACISTIRLIPCNNLAMQRLVTLPLCRVKIDIHMVQWVERGLQVYSLILASNLCRRLALALEGEILACGVNLLMVSEQRVLLVPNLHRASTVLRNLVSVATRSRHPIPEKQSTYLWYQDLVSWSHTRRYSLSIPVQPSGSNS